MNGKIIVYCGETQRGPGICKALHVNSVRKDGYLESEDSAVTWCVGHLVTMSYPEVYDEKLQALESRDPAFYPGKIPL